MIISSIYRKDIEAISWRYYIYARDIIYSSQNRLNASNIDECILFHMGELVVMQVVVLIMINLIIFWMHYARLTKYKVWGIRSFFW